MDLEQLIKQSKFKNEHQKAFINILYTSNELNLKNAVALKPFGITPEQFNVLRILRGQYPKPITVNIIIDRMLNKSSNASRLVEKLRVKKLAERATCLEDRRAVNILITQKGLDLLKQIDEMEEQWLYEIKQNLTVKEAEELNRLLNKIRSKNNKS